MWTVAGALLPGSGHRLKRVDNRRERTVTAVPLLCCAGAVTALSCCVLLAGKHTILHFQYTAFFGILEHRHSFYIWLATPASSQESRVLTSRESVSRKISVWVLFFKIISSQRSTH